MVPTGACVVVIVSPACEGLFLVAASVEFGELVMLLASLDAAFSLVDWSCEQALSPVAASSAASVVIVRCGRIGVLLSLRVVFLCHRV